MQLQTVANKTKISKSPYKQNKKKTKISWYFLFGDSAWDGNFEGFLNERCAADFSLLNLPKGKSLGRSKPATNS